MPLEVEENITANLDVACATASWMSSSSRCRSGGSILTHPLYDEPFEVVVNNDHRWAARRSIKAPELAEEKVLLLDSGHCFSNQVAEACPDLSRGVVRTAARHVAGNHTQYGRLRSGHYGVACLGQR